MSTRPLVLIAALIAGATHPLQAQAAPASWRARFNGEWVGAATVLSDGRAAPYRILLVVTESTISGEVCFDDRRYGPVGPEATLRDSVLVFEVGAGGHASITAVLHGDHLAVTASAMGGDFLTANLTKRSAAQSAKPVPCAVREGGP